MNMATIDEATLERDEQDHVICPVCGEPVNVGQVGLSNLTKRHLGSKKCKEAQFKGKKGKGKGTNQNIGQFFSKKAPLVASRADKQPSIISKPLAMDPIRSDGTPTTERLKEKQPVSMIQQLKVLVNIVLKEDDANQSEDEPFLRGFTSPPGNYDNSELSHDEVWEDLVNPALHRGFGWGEEVNIEKVRRAGRRRVEGFLEFVDYFVGWRSLSEGLFEGRLLRLHDVLKEINTLQHPIEDTQVSLPPQDLADTPGEARSTDFMLYDDEIIEISGPTVQVSLPKPRKRMLQCPGYTFPMPEGLSPHSAYPFALHDSKNNPPWNYTVQNGALFLFSKLCKTSVDTTDGSRASACSSCARLEGNMALEGIVSRMKEGVKEGNNFAYHGMGGLHELLKRKNKQIEFYRLRGLNQGRVLATRATSLSDHKRFLNAVAAQKVERLDRIIRVGLNQKQSISSLLEQCLKAAKGLYKPKTFEEEDYMRGLLLWKLGGNRVAEIAHRSLGLPGITTLRKRISVVPLIPSPGRPTIEEISTNVKSTFAPVLDILRPQTGGAANRHAVLMLDEIATEKRIRWDSRTNQFLGLCREHAYNVSLEFGSERDMEELFLSLDDGGVHYASEATVGALGVLSDNHQIYAARGILISGDCKRENGEAHAEVLQTIIDGVDQQKDSTKIRIVSVASDGETRRGSALVNLTFKYILSPESPLYALLHNLAFMNLYVGDDDLTADKDWKHVFKRLRNLLLRQCGVVVDGFRITPSVLRAHFQEAGLSADHIRAILNPEDLQDVKLAFDLLKDIWSLPRTLPYANPGFAQAREAMWKLGKALYHLVFPYLCVDLTLSEQLEHLSAAAHLFLYLYREAGKEFIPSLLFIDIMIMLKNIYFCVAKAKVDDPNGSFWIILLGTDRLEEIFGVLRTMIGSDSNLDILQLCWRLGSTAEVANILALKPNWDSSPRRLKLPALDRDSVALPQGSDHIKPRSWRGSNNVGGVVLLTSWRRGRRLIEGDFPEAAKIFAEMEASKTRVDILTPNGVLLVNGAVGDDDVDESIEMEAGYSDPRDCEVEDGNGAADARVEVEDAFAEEDFDLQRPDGSPVQKGAFSRDIVSQGKTVTKSRALAAYSKYRKAASSTDRLKRVQAVHRFTAQPKALSIDLQTFRDPDSQNTSLVIHDPIATVLCCDNRMWLCIGEVNSLRVDSISVDQIDSHLLIEDTVTVSFQLLGLRTCTVSEVSASKAFDWRTYATTESTFTVPGRYIDIINPELSSSPTSANSTPFYVLDSPFLVALAASLYARLSVADLKGAAKIAVSKEFPYREHGDAALSLIRPESIDSGDRAPGPSANTDHQTVVQLSPIEAAAEELTVPVPQTALCLTFENPTQVAPVSSQSSACQPLARPQRSRRKRQVDDMDNNENIKNCVCGSIAPSNGTDSIQCKRKGCETEWCTEMGDALIEHFKLRQANGWMDGYLNRR
ncbi:hypothetical protein D9615_007901 [Tricholomella constricta]|uniref:Uncharacterized protein n=1 Tax=Tricholomella constricta TaxID=117010 RepID=A0A8H5M0U0_9AGAR|nr:hypothetical protein D9615_007901 [Tricholomella constricta]